METDLETLRDAFTKLGIEFEEDKYMETSTLSLHANTRKVDGYCGFHTEFNFDTNGRFIEAGIFE
jgi:hypothetical protein